MPLPPDILMQRVQVLALVLGPGWAGWALARALWPAAPVTRRLVAAMSIGMLLVWAIVMVLGNAMHFNAIAQLVACVVIGGAGWWAARRTGDPSVPRVATSISPGALLWTVPCVLVLACVAGRFYFNGIEMFSDDLAYHFVVPAEWVRRESLFHPTISMAHYYPFNAHAVAASLVAITRSVDEVWIAGLYWVALVVATLLAFASVVPRASAPLAMVATLFLTSEMMLWFASRFCSSDLAGAASLLVAFLFVTARPGAETAERRADSVLAALMAGFAVGCKPSLVVPAAIACLAIAVILWRASGTRSEALRWMALAAAAFLLTASYWYARNWIVAGNPLYPFRVGPFYGQIQSKHIDNTTIWYWVMKTPADLAMWRMLVTSLLDWPLYNGLLSLAGALAGGVALGVSYRRQRLGGAPLLPFDAVWLWVAAVAFFLFHLKAPFSGGTLEATAMTVYPRYAMFAFLAGLVFAALVVGGLWGRQPSTRMIALPAWAIPTLCVLAAVLVVGRPLWADRRDMPIDFVPDQRPLRLGIAALERLPDGARLATLSTRTWENGYLYGSRLQFEPVWLDEYGQIMPPLHTVYNWQRRKLKQDYPRYGIVHTEAKLAPERYVATLRASGIDYLVVTKYSFATPVWARQREIVAASPEMTRVYADGFTEIYTWRDHEEESP